MVTMDQIFILIHVLSVIAWVSTLPIAIILRKSMDKMSELSDIRKVGELVKVNTYLSIGGMVGILISGGALVGPDWFQFSGELWLPLKQVIFVIAVVVGLYFTRKRNDVFVETLENEDSGKEDIISSFKDLEMVSHIVLTLVFINIILGILKPF